MKLVWSGTACKYITHHTKCYVMQLVQVCQTQTSWDQHCRAARTLCELATSTSTLLIAQFLGSIILTLNFSLGNSYRVCPTQTSWDQHRRAARTLRKLATPTSILPIPHTHKVPPTVDRERWCHSLVKGSEYHPLRYRTHSNTCFVHDAQLSWRSGRSSHGWRLQGEGRARSFKPRQRSVRVNLNA